MESNSSGVNTFNFRSFKVDQVALNMVPNIQILELANYAQYDWDINLRVRHVTFFTKVKVYVAGLDCELSLFQKTPTGRVATPAVTLNIGCAGSFSSENRLPKEVEEQIVKLQFTALMFTQLRGAISAILANSGYGSVLLPLVNVPAMFEKKLDQIQIHQVE